MYKLISSILLFGTLTLLSCASSHASTTNSPMDNGPKAAIEAFSDAIADNNAEALEKVLHPDFTVIIPRYPTADKNTVLDRATYIALIGSKKIGGERYEITFQDVTLTDYNANVIVTLDGPKSTMQASFLLTRVTNGSWQIVVDFPILKQK